MIPEAAKSVATAALERLAETPEGRRCLDESPAILVFGSFPAGLQRPDSDIDILCVGAERFRVKTPRIDLTVLTEADLTGPDWLGSELAFHISRYGVRLRGLPIWINGVSLNSHSVENKRRRIRAFLRILPHKWVSLDEQFRRKYATKLRREIQRLLLLESGIPVPATWLLDNSWGTVLPGSDVVGRLRQVLPSQDTRFARDLYDRIESAVQQNAHSQF